MVLLALGPLRPMLISYLERVARQELPAADSGQPEEQLGQAEEAGSADAEAPATELPAADLRPADLADAEFRGELVLMVDGGIPAFTEEEKDAARASTGEETYSSLDSLGRCGVCTAVITKEMMPTEERGAIGMIKPSGWKVARYDDLIEDKYLYHRCHLIAFILTGENDNELNLITGTGHMNMEGMLPYERKIAKHMWKENAKVLYRVKPIFKGDELVARGIHMEGLSLDDNGEDICFNIYVFNIQPGVEIDYATGESRPMSQEDAG